MAMHESGSLPKVTPRMAKAALAVSPPEDERDWRPEIGQAVDRARTLLKWSLKELAAAVQRDERQVKRWIDGLERPQFDALFGVQKLRGPLVQALAEIADSEDVQVYTEIRIRRAAS